MVVPCVLVCDWDAPSENDCVPEGVRVCVSEAV